MNDIIKIIKSLEDWDVLIDGVTQTVKHETKKHEGGFLGALLAPLAASLVHPVISLAVKGKRSWKSQKRIHEEKVLVLIHPLSNIEITNYFNYEPRFNDAFSRNDLLRTKDGAYVINLYDKNSKGTYWVSLFIDRNTEILPFFCNWIYSFRSIN